MRNLFLVLLLLLGLIGSKQLSAQGITPFQHNRNLGMGSVSAPLDGLAASALQPAALTGVDRWAIALSGTQYFWLPEVRTGNLQYVLPTRAGNFGLQVQYYGFEAYNETSLGLAYARKLTEKFSLGGRFIYLNTRVPETGSGGLVTFDLGMIYKLNADWQLGMSLYNPALQEKLPGEYLPTTLRLGAAHRLGKQATLAAELEKTLAYQLRGRVGLEYLPVEQVRIVAGVQSNPATFSLGLGWQSTSGLSIDLVQEYHLILGVSPGISISYQAPAK
ncbi:MAG: hypothetical protein KDC34_04580 [Saprospiraceae bacterium]|nr:hypothetical protein [Saprospiraceae bacterium]